MESLAGKRVLVTGAGVGIGQGIVKELGRQGANVVIHYGGSREGAEEAAAEINVNGAMASTIQGDLRLVDECFRVVDTAVERLGGLDALVNNAGVTRAQPVVETTESLYDEMFDLNMKGYFFCAQRAIPHLDAGSSIVNITSVHGGGGAPNHVAYAGTKGAIVAFTRSLAIELAPRQIRVNAIGPGLIEVPRYFGFPGYTRELGDSMVPMGRVGLPDDIATVVAFLISDSAGFVTGQTLYVDGGTNARMGISRRWDDDE